MYEKLLEYSVEFNEVLAETFRLLPFLLCAVVSCAVLLGGIISFIEYVITMIKGAKHEH